MAFMDLFAKSKVSNPIFKVKDENIGELINNTLCIFYLEGNGVNCSPLVKKGEEVRVGQIIGKENDDFSIPLISSVSGTVLEISDNIDFLGKKVKAIVVGDIKEGNQVENRIDLETLSKEELLSKLQELGLTDANGLPLSLKYRAFEGNKIVVSSYDKEGNFSRNEVLEKKESAINIALEAIKVLVKDSEVKIIKNKEITEKLIKKEFGEDVSLEKIIVEDISTLVYLGEAILTGKPKNYEYITVFGGSVDGGKVVKVRLGTTLEDLFKGLNGRDNEVYKIVVGGALNGISQFSTKVGVSNNIKSVLFLNEKEGKKDVEGNCIRCSKCLRVCPEGLNPIKLVELWKRGEKEEFIKFGGNKCSDCGLCSYECPSTIELAHKIKTAKHFIK